MNKLILPDSNIISEITKAKSCQKVVETYKANLNHIVLAITVWHELLYGLYNMPAGKRKKDVENFYKSEVIKLPMCHYTLECANIHAKIRADCRKIGKSLSFSDSQIASIALFNNAILVTRNVDDFRHIDGLVIENWFEG